MTTSRLRIGTRASALALWQAEWVAARLCEHGVAVELVKLSTRGDREQAGPIRGIAGGDGVFTRELQRALLAQEIDLAVHSLKDLPTEPVAGLYLAAVPERGPVGDAIICREVAGFEGLPDGAVVGTGSLRRRAQLWHARPGLQMADLRGNVDTRLRKLAAGQYDAIVLAEAGLHRLGLDRHMTQVLPIERVLPAVGQGALGLEARVGDANTAAALAPLDHAASHAAVRAERAMLAAISGGCLAPIGAWCRPQGASIRLSAVVLSCDGRRRIAADASDDPSRSEELGRHVAEALLAQGAAALIAESRVQTPAP